MKLALLVLAATSLQAQQTITARQVIDRIQQHLGVTLPANTVDTFKAGNPDEPVKGIAVTMMATYDVLERAARAGNTLVITHEPTFYNHLDKTSDLEKQDDPVLAAKQKFITDHHLVVWRFHDGWHLHNPDGILLGMTRALGWQRYQNADQPHLFQLPETSLSELAASVKSKLNINVLRVVGDRNLRVAKVAMLPGAAGSAKQIQLLERPDVEALVIGETPEWETVEYVADAASESRHKALLILGHIPSEQAGMEECTAWLRGFISEVPVTFVPAKEPFWLPGSR
ncbi:MAG TPA: Nif3-like dinuclear metal center hexameric protein [Bryobacteraceae bacterium]|jgi:putative NIF3 family GTP cyclohydrolase 1 type 2|nr:Nif3-like dinuclear metal center hexameric protein [Bryobacteraceae bacterium]